MTQFIQKRIVKFIAVSLVLMMAVVACASPIAQQNNSGNRSYYNANYGSALQAYQAAQVESPDRPEAYFNAASAYVGLDEPDLAVAALEEALENADEDLIIEAYYNLGNAYQGAGIFDKAIDAYQEALLRNPDHEDARYNLEIALLRYLPPSPTAQEQKTEPDVDQTDPETTPTDQPGGFDGPTPTPPPIDYDLTEPPLDGQSDEGEEDSSTPVPRSQGDMTVEQAERILDQIQEDQEALSDYLEDEASEGDVSERDW